MAFVAETIRLGGVGILNWDRRVAEAMGPVCGVKGMDWSWWCCGTLEEVHTVCLVGAEDLLANGYEMVSAISKTLSL